VTGAKYDALVFHSYPIKIPVTDGDTLYRDRVKSNLSRVHAGLMTLKTALLSNNKSPDAIWVTEWDGMRGGEKWSKQTMGAAEPLFVVSQLAEYMEAGIPYATWWAQGMDGICTKANYDASGDTAYSWADCGDATTVYTDQVTWAKEVNVGLKPGELTPAGRGFQLLHQSGFVAEGESMLSTHTDLNNAPWLESYAATHKSGYAVILINRDRDQTHTIPVIIDGMKAGSSVQQWTYGREQYDAARKGNWSLGPAMTTSGPWSGQYMAKLPPWSASILIFDK
jgi:hypothetical protein